VDDVPRRARTVHPFKLVVVGPEWLFASEVLAKVRTFDGLIGALEQLD